MKINRKILILLGTGLAAIGGSYISFQKLRQLWLFAKIVEKAQSFVGQREIEPNRGFFDESFQKIMTTIGKWQPSFEWCACFARLIWLLVLTGHRKEVAARLLSPSSQLTFKNFAIDKSGYFQVTTSNPRMGAIVIWQYLPDPTRGHTGIYVGKLGPNFIVIEGNKRQKVSICQYSPEKMLMPTSNMKLRGYINLK